MFLTKNRDSKVENAEILLDVIRNVVGKYKTVIIVNDNNDNLSTIFAFFNRIGVDNINYILEPNKDILCTLEFGNHIDGASCSIQKNITIRASDLAFYPCFEAAKRGILKYGYIDFETLEILPENVELAALLYFYNPTFSNPRCDRCKYAVICHKGCYIDNFLKNKDVTSPIVENCKTYKEEMDKMIESNPKLNRLLLDRRNLPECTK